MKEPRTLCDFAKLRYFNALRWRNLWTILLYAFGLTVVLFLCGAIFLFIRSTWLPGALTILGSIVNSAGIIWVGKQRTTAVSEEKEAFKQLKKECSPPGRTLIGIKQQPWFDELQSLAWKSLIWPTARRQGESKDEG